MDMLVESATQDVRAMLQDAIMAVNVASAAGQEATNAIAEQASNPELKDLMRTGARYSKTWHERLSQAAQALGTDRAAPDANPIIDAIQKVGGKIIKDAEDPTARDLGIIASGQLALHYYIAAFGTMAAYARLLGLQEVAQSIHDCLTEAKQGDEHYTDLAAKIAHTA